MGVMMVTMLGRSRIGRTNLGGVEGGPPKQSSCCPQNQGQLADGTVRYLS